MRDYVFGMDKKKDSKGREQLLALVLTSLTAIVTGGITAWATVASAAAKADSASTEAKSATGSAEGANQRVSQAEKSISELRSLVSDAGQVPLGGIVAWWGSTADGKEGIPNGFELCDGTKVTTAGPLQHVIKPNLLNLFLKGSAGKGRRSRRKADRGLCCGYWTNDEGAHAHAGADSKP